MSFLQSALASSCGLAAVAALLLALSQGGRRGLAGAGALFAAWAGLWTASLVLAGPPPAWAALMIEIVLLAVFARIAWKSDRIWILWVLAFAALAAALSLARVREPRLDAVRWSEALFAAQLAASAGGFAGLLEGWRPARNRTR